MASLDEIYHIISLRISIHDFMKDVKDDSIRFIGIDATNQAHGILINRPISRMDECLADAPVLPHPSSGKERIRQRYYLPLNAREFVKIKLAGRDVLLVLPKWFYDSIPGTKCFRLVEQPPIIKYVDSRIQRGEAWDEQLHAHCEQTEPTPVFELLPLSLEELNEMFGKELGRPLPTEPIPEVKQEPVSEVIDNPVVPSEGALAQPVKSVEELFSTTTVKYYYSDNGEVGVYYNRVTLLEYLSKKYRNAFNYIGVDSENNLYALNHIYNSRMYKYTISGVEIEVFKINLGNPPRQKYEVTNRPFKLSFGDLFNDEPSKPASNVTVYKDDKSTYNLNPLWIQDVYIIIPEWFKSKTVLGTNFFRLVEHEPVVTISRNSFRLFELVPMSLEELNEISRIKLQGRPAKIQEGVVPFINKEALAPPENPPPKEENTLSRPEKPPPSEGALSEKKLKSVEELFSTTVLKFISELSKIRELNLPVTKFLNRFGSFIVIDDENKIHGILYSINYSPIIRINDKHRRDQKMLFVILEELFPRSKYHAKFVPPFQQSDGTFIQHVLLIKPDISEKNSAKKFFRLVEQPPAMLNDRGQYTFGLDKDTIDMYKERPLRVFELVPMSLEELNDIFGQKRGGKTKRRNKKNRKSRKNKH